MFAFKAAKSQTRPGEGRAGSLSAVPSAVSARALRPRNEFGAQDLYHGGASRRSAAPAAPQISWNFGNTSVSPGPQDRQGTPSPPHVDSLEHEADAIAGRALDSGRSHPLLDQGLARARVHTGPESEAAAAARNAAAVTVGNDIFFGAGRYRPDTWLGRRLIAHEAVHVAQQMRVGRPMVLCQAANTGVQMPPLQISSSLNPVEQSVSHLDRLRDAGVTANTPTIAHAAADVERNSPDPAALLPFTPSGWNGTEILTKLGQYDRMPGTDSDAIRCVQAVGMAAHVPDGPDAVKGYFSSMILQGLLTGQVTSRKHTAIEVLKHVSQRIESKRATYGDLSWAQEALHDLFYDDVSGTPLTDIPQQVNPAMDLSKNMQPMDVWCNTPQEVMAQASQLKSGEQLLVEEWTVSLNTTFDQLSEQNINVAEGHSTTVTINHHPVSIRRIPMDRRPPHSALDFNRDTRAGHQLLIIKDSASGSLRLYEPEVTQSGRHFEGLASDGSNLTDYFKDQPNFGIYCYIEIIGKLQSGPMAAITQGTTRP